MKIHTKFATAAVTLIAGAMAQAVEPKFIVYPKGVNTPITVTLLTSDGKVGRASPFYDNYRPQVQFSASRKQITCAIRVPQEIEKVEPGQTADVAMICLEEFKVRPDETSFVVFEGGRKVAVGRLK
jgi:translation elongation factor EF-Tu-like GTPase